MIDPIRGGLVGLTVLMLASMPAMAKSPRTAPVGTPCFCAQSCAARGVTYSAWTDPAGARVNLSACPAADPAALSANRGLCPCGNPLDWYRLWNELKPPQPNRTSPNH